MRSRLIVFIFLACFYGLSARPGTNVMPAPFLLMTATNESEIQQWGKQRFGLAPLQHFEVKGQHVAVLLGDAGSGLTLRTIYVYVEANNAWRLVAVRFTNTSEVRVEQRADALVFKSKTGKELLNLSAEGLSLAFDRAEQ
jgi:hypothetical protein